MQRPACDTPTLTPDVLIAGGGPCGLMLAIELGRRGIACLLVDAKPPKDAVLPGGNGLAFDWRLIAGRRWPCPWMLAGGLTPENVAEAIRLTNARQVDVSSGVEAAPGVKDAGRIAAFVKASRMDGPPILR